MGLFDAIKKKNENVQNEINEIYKNMSKNEKVMNFVYSMCNAFDKQNEKNVLEFLYTDIRNYFEFEIKNNGVIIKWYSSALESDQLSESGMNLFKQDRGIAKTEEITFGQYDLAYLPNSKYEIALCILLADTMSTRLNYLKVVNLRLLNSNCTNKMRVSYNQEANSSWG